MYWEEVEVLFAVKPLEGLGLAVKNLTTLVEC
jgi:hypothetical protein